MKHTSFSYIRSTTCVLIGLFVVVLSLSAASGKEKAAETAARALVGRVVPSVAGQFKIQIIPKTDESDLFELESDGDTIVLRGNNGVSVASALNYYLKHFAHCQITWNGTNLNLPDPLPGVPEKIQKKTPYKYRYYLNYCTFNYSMSWWDWDRWQKEIDYMALNGINMPLAVTGQNSVWKRVYNRLGFSDKELEGFFSGPAYFNWFWMGNLDGWGGPLPQQFMEAHEELQKKILQQERSLGMKPVLPAFTGHVPPNFQKKFPDVRLKRTSWVGFPKVCILNPEEPLFSEIGRLFIQEEIKTYGTDHLYSADTFNENTPPDNDSMYLNNVSRKVFQCMADADPDAVWVMQGWLFYHSRDFWKTKEIKALLNVVPDDRMIILDLWSERHPVWNRTSAYFGKPWIWCMLHNFGKNINLSGCMDRVADQPAKTLQDSSAGKMSGIGLTMEGIEQNPVVYELMLENVWRNTPIDLNSWLKDYALCRYGKKSEEVDKAWELLSRSVYADTVTNGGAESIVTARPTFAKNPGGTSSVNLPYHPMDLVNAWSLLLGPSEELRHSDGYQFDVVDITRQVLANYASVLHQQLILDYQNKDLTAFRTSSQRFLELLSDMDELLATRKDFLLGCWLESAKSWGTTQEEKQLYERNARDLITLWGDKDCRLNEYACKQWSGMLCGFYQVRWAAFLREAERCLVKHRTFNHKKFTEEMKSWEWKWVNSNTCFPTETQGDPINVARRIYGKYDPSIRIAYAH
jgi:alpha-N-acetylglucosaminidase